MIRYSITSQALLDQIESRVPGWLAKAKKKTARFKKSQTIRGEIEQLV